MKAITSEGEDKVHPFSRVWVYGSGCEVDGDTFPFLFINEGTATLSASAHGAAILRDAITCHKIQLLEHTGTYYLYLPVALPNLRDSDPWSPCFCYGMSALVLLWDAGVLIVPMSAKAYHISTGVDTIATTDHGENAMIKIWTTKRSSSCPQGRVSGYFD